MLRIQKQALKLSTVSSFQASYWWTRSFLNRHPSLKQIVRRQLESNAGESISEPDSNSESDADSEQC